MENRSKHRGELTMLEEEEKAVKAVILSNALRTYEKKLKSLQEQGIVDRQTELIVKHLKQVVEDEREN